MPRRGGASLRPAPNRRVLLLGAAALMFLGVLLLRIDVGDTQHLVTLLFVVPIALLAVELGLAWGLAAAGVALAIYGAWDVLWADSGQSFLDYLARGTAFFVLGGAVGSLADRLRRVSIESGRFWELSTDPLCTAGFDGFFQRLNPAWERTLGWTKQELRARPFIEFVHPDDREQTEAEAARLTEPGFETFDFENRYRCKDGTYRTMRWSATADSGAGIIYAIARDGTEAVRAEREAEAAREEAERANVAKSEFLSRMSHELRTPLNAVIGFGQLLELDELEPNQSEAVEQILKGGRHLLALINEVLDISRIDAGTIAVSLEPVHLGSVLAEVLSLIRPLADAAEVQLLADPAEIADAHVLADQQRLVQVLINLLSNAVKYNQPGGNVTVKFAKLSGGRVQLAVSDTGIGMAPDQLARLFDPFDRLGAERSDIEGTGLGLSLSKRLVEVMNGAIEAESEPGVGTTMRVALESAEAPPDHGASTNGGPVSGAELDRPQRTIVYIEDNLSNLKLVERLLEGMPEVRLIPAIQGRLGVELARQHHPDLILLDLHLPDLHGREVLQQLKRDPATAAIPVVMLSADATPGQVDRLLAEGASEYLTKPIDLQRLLHMVAGSIAVATGPLE